MFFRLSASQTQTRVQLPAQRNVVHIPNPAYKSLFASVLFQPVEHRTLFKLQNNLTDGYLQTLQWANIKTRRKAQYPLWKIGVNSFALMRGERKNKRMFTNVRGEPTLVTDHNSGAVAAQYKSPFTGPIGAGFQRC